MAILNEYKLDYCTIQHRDDNILLIEINEGVEVDAEMTNELTRMADEKMTSEFGILANRINSYSLSFEAMNALAKYNNMVAMAVVVYSNKSRLLAETQNYFLSTLKKKPIKIFMDIDPAVTWLQTTLKNSSQSE